MIFDNDGWYDTYCSPAPTPEPAAYARRILVHYFEQAFKAAGQPWDSDYTAEIEGAIDDLIAAAVAQAKGGA